LTSVNSGVSYPCTIASDAYAALTCGVRRFDASVGGIGGCPFALGAAGNLATEDLALLAHRAGLHTGIQLRGLLAAVDCAERLLGRSLGGRSIAWLRRNIDRLEHEGQRPCA
jgi:hydroxymethylglutaryl-CoA lyase